jgi:hypothetical protein
VYLPKLYPSSHHRFVKRPPFRILPHPPPKQPKALKANAEGAVRELRLNANYITRFGQVALGEAVDIVHELGRGRVTTVSF